VSHVLKRGVFEEYVDQENELKLFSEIQKAVASSEKGLANPAAVGLGAFGATTMLLQLHNLGFVGIGAVMWLAFIFGGLAQLVAGFLEYRNGNNFGFAAFTTYGAFWIALGGIWLNAQLKFTAISGTDVGWFLVIFTLLTGIYLIGAMRQNSALAWVFLTLFLGFILLDIGHLVPGAEVFNKIAGVELIICALVAWYLMSHVIFTPLRLNLPAGKAWVK
jgi:succinate-acetate transporter protein